MTPIEGTGLLYVSNTDSDWFIQIDGQKNFVLLSGRWYVGNTHSAPWLTSRRISCRRTLPRSRRIVTKVMCSQRRGTPAADDAVANNQIPQTAAVDRANFDQPAVDYDGDPQFQPIEKSNCSYAVNTGSAVLQVGPELLLLSGCGLVSGPRPAWAVGDLHARAAGMLSIAAIVSVVSVPVRARLRVHAGRLLSRIYAGIYRVVSVSSLRRVWDGISLSAVGRARVYVAPAHLRIRGAL